MEFDKGFGVNILNAHKDQIEERKREEQRAAEVARERAERLQQLEPYIGLSEAVKRKTYKLGMDKNGDEGPTTYKMRFDLDNPNWGNPEATTSRLMVSWEDDEKLTKTLIPDLTPGNQNEHPHFKLTILLHDSNFGETEHYLATLKPPLLDVDGVPHNKDDCGIYLEATLPQDNGYGSADWEEFVVGVIKETTDLYLREESEQSSRFG